MKHKNVYKSLLCNSKTPHFIYVNQRGPTTGSRATCGPRTEF